MTDNHYARAAVTVALLALLFALTGCASQTVKLIHPQSGASAECSASGFGVGVSIADGIVGGCSRAYEERGYLPLERLRPEQRADLERRGLLPKD